LRSDRSAARLVRNGGPPLGSERLTTGAQTRTVASTPGAVAAQGANAAQRADTMHSSANPQALTPTVMANNAAAENKKPPSTQPVHQAWWHWFW
jgi:hypothetical protein